MWLFLLVLGYSLMLSGKSRNRSLKRVAPAPPGGKSQEVTVNADQIHSSEQLSPTSSDIPNGVCIQREPENHSLDNKLVSEKETNEFVPCSHVVSVERTDCGSSPIHIPSKLALSGKEKEMNKSVVDKTDCATSPIPSPIKTSSVVQQDNQSELIDASTIPLPPGLGSGLIEEVRKNTGLSYEKSGVAVETVLGHLGFKIPEIAPVLDKVCLTLHEVCSCIILPSCLHRFF